MNDSAPASLQNAVLIGFMGCGKSSVARRLAQLLNWPSLDLDAQIEDRINTSIKEFFATHGEVAFRQIESEELQKALSQHGVLATGGGVPTQSHNRELLQNAQKMGVSCVIYLRATPETLATRIRRQPDVRPLIDGNRVLDWSETVARVQFLLEQRAPFYESCADFIIDGDTLSAHQIAQIALAFVAPPKTCS